MGNNIPDPPFIYEGIDHVSQTKAAQASLTATFAQAANRFGEVLDSAKKPGMPLSILANVTREAPLGALLAAFLLGIAVARRR